MSARLACIADFEKKAEQILDKKTADYIGCGAGEQLTLNLNREAFRRLRIHPKYFRNVTQVDTSCRILGCDLKWPLGISPSALQKWSHEDGEAGNAKAAGKMGSIFILSFFSSTSLEEVAKAAPDTDKWLQLYICKDRTITEQLVRRAEKCNFKAIVLTVDQPIIGQQWTAYRNNLQVPPHLTYANFTESTDYIEYMERAVSWHDLKWLVEYTHLPVIAKGILTAEDAFLAQKAGCAGVIVSNHGARHLDGLEATIHVLPSIVEAVGVSLVVMLDSGIRTGNDIFKALALGAKMVFIGRPAVWGLVCGGENGVRELLELLHTDFVKVLTLAGCQNLKAIESDMVRMDAAYSKL